MDEDLTNLYSPVPAPGTPTPVTPGFSYSGGFTPANQAMMGNLSGANPNALPPSMPVGSGNTMYQGPVFGQEDIGNVGGVVGMNEDTKQAYIPEVPDASEAQTSEFSDAYNKGYTTTSDTRAESMARGAAAGSYFGPAGTYIGAGIGWLSGHKEGETAAAGTMQAARMAKRDDRSGDREVRKDARKAMQSDLEASGVGKGKARRQSRRMKRGLRRGQRRERKDSWKNFKGDQKLQAQDDAYDLEQQYT